MQENFEDKVAWAEQRVERVWKAAIRKSRLHNTLSALYWFLAFLVPTGLAIMCYLPEGQCRARMNIAVLLVSGLSLALQATVTAMRFKERAARGRSAVNELEIFILKYRSKLIDDEVFMLGIQKFLTDTSQEEGP
jgi:hypothetical protein